MSLSRSQPTTIFPYDLAIVDELVEHRPFGDEPPFVSLTTVIRPATHPLMLWRPRPRDVLDHFELWIPRRLPREFAHLMGRPTSLALRCEAVDEGGTEIRWWFESVTWQEGEETISRSTLEGLTGEAVYVPASKCRCEEIRRFGVSDRFIGGWWSVKPGT